MLQKTLSATLLEHDDHPPSHSVFGFWLYLMTDCVIFAALFATFAVLGHQYAGGQTAKELFDIPGVAVETAALLLSSITYGFAMLAAYQQRRGALLAWLAVTFVLGAAFLAMELREFSHLIAEGAGPQRSAFLSSFFTLVGCHGAHVTAGLLWIGTMMAQIWAKGFREHVMRRLLCLSVFWHALDIIWVGIFTIVYLIGTLP